MWIKICGVRDVAMAVAIAEAVADAIGLNFYSRSHRVVELDEAARIVSALPERVEPIGVFVNQSAAEVRKIAAACGLRTLQMHGDESAELLAELSDFQLIRVFRVGAEGLAPVRDSLKTLAAAGVRLRACLVDANVKGAYGGTGETAPWDLLARDWPAADWPPLILAGGLKPQNVREAIGIVHPWGVDVAGGVESTPGQKSLTLVRQFIENARAAS